MAPFALVIGGVVPVVNLDGVKAGQRNFIGELLADIFLGKITSSSDPAIGALNPKTMFPSLQIRVAYRADGWGCTFNWTHSLSKVSPEGKIKFREGNVVNFPTGTGHKGSEGVASYVGPLELALAMRHDIAFARFKKKSRVFVVTSAENFRAPAATVDWNSSGFYEILTYAAGKDAWPIAATTFVLMPRHSSDTRRSAEALRFFGWALEHGQEDAKNLKFRLPDELVKRVEDYWQRNIK